jgi:AI-2 transport protein TqsA
VIGPLGTVLAMPLTLVAKALLLDVDPSTRWISSPITGGPAPPNELDASETPQPGPPGGPGSATSSGDGQKPLLTAPQP